MSLDNCPTCGRRITDTDPNGCELESGQRYCLAHAPADSEVRAACRRFVAEPGDMHPVADPRPSSAVLHRRAAAPTNLVEAARGALDAYDLHLKSGGDPELGMALARMMGHLEYHVGKAEQGR